jgi:biopolymer transport protein ExbD
MTGIKRRQSRGRAAPVVEINMIPLIDVSLVLLIIFMVMTPFLVQQQIRVNLPRSSSANESPDRPIVISIQKAGEISLNGRAVAASTLEAALKPLLGPKGERPVMIQADRELPLQQVVSVMDIAKRLKVQKLGISVEQPK